MFRCRWWLNLGTTSRDGVGATVLLVVDVWFNLFFQLPHVHMPWSLLTLAASTLPLTWRRRRPVAVFAVISVVVVAGTAMSLGVSEVGVMIAIYTVATLHTREALWCLVVFCVLKAGAEILSDEAPAWIPLVLVLYYAAYERGNQQRHHRILVAQLSQRTRELQREREERERLATVAERARIARELHDIVAHTVSVMVLYTSVAKRAVGHDPVAATAALGQVETSG